MPQSVRSSLRLRGVRLLSQSRQSSFRLLSRRSSPAAGEVRFWVGLDLVQGALVPKPFAFRGAGKHIEVWVSGDLAFPAGDCRNGERTQITDAQVQSLVRAFDRTIYPRMSKVFSVPPSRDGTNSPLPPPFNPRGAGDKVVVLVDNIRDEAYYDANNASGFASAIGIYSSAVDGLFDRNVMSIDAYDWLHRTGSRPPHQPSPGDGCAHSPAWPFLIEGVFAHEYHHLLQHHEDPDETDWLDEGLAEWSRSLTGYSDPDRPVSEVGYDQHMQCFLGNLPDFEGGPENSLTVWGDGGDANCDYGSVYSFMEYAHRRQGAKLMTALHRGDANGLAGVQEALGRRRDAQELLHDWTAHLARGRINWENPYAFAAPGAPPNGADFVRLRDEQGRYLRVRDLRSLGFDGATRIPAQPVEWVVDPAPPGGGPAALYSGAGNDLDRTIVRPLTVPAGGASLGFQAQWNVEEDPSGGWDFTFVQVSTDGGATYASIPCTSSRTDASPNARLVMHENLPGYTAYSAWRSETCDLSALAGKQILLAFRHLTDGSIPGDPDDPAATIPPGFWLRGLTLAGAPVADGSSLAGWLSPSQARPTAVHGFTLQLVAYSERGSKHGAVLRIPLDRQHDRELPGWILRRLLPDRADLLGAVVVHDDPTETVQDPAPYTLRVNGVLQPGG